MLLLRASLLYVVNVAITFFKGYGHTPTVDIPRQCTLLLGADFDLQYRKFGLI